MNKGFVAYSVFTSLLAALLWQLTGWDLSSSSPAVHWNALAAFLVLGFLAEASYLTLRVGARETQSSVAFVPFVASVMLFDTGWASLVVGAAMLSVEAVIKRKSAVRVLFNTSQIMVSVVAASLAFKALGGAPSLDHFVFVPVAVGAAVISYFLVNSAAVSGAVAIAYGQQLSAAWARIGGASLVYDLCASLLTPLLAFLYIKFQVPGILLLIVPLYFVRHLYQLTLQLEQVNRDLLELMVKAIEARDPYTSGHSQRVAEIAAALAREVGLGGKVVDQVRTAALLHDVGKIHEEYAPLLRKDGRLDPTEKALMQTHASRSAELVGTISGFRGAIVDNVRHHHENYDGSGYPTGLHGDSIPLGARIIMIADTVDAMSTDRPYRKALSADQVAAELNRCAGKQFDPSLVKVFLSSPKLLNMVTARSRPQSADNRRLEPPPMPSRYRRWAALDR